MTAVIFVLVTTLRKAGITVAD